MIDFSKILRFDACHVRVVAEDGEVRMDAGATMTPEQTLDLVETLLAARRVVIALRPEASDG